MDPAPGSTPTPTVRSLRGGPVAALACLAVGSALIATATGARPVAAGVLALAACAQVAVTCALVHRRQGHPWRLRTPDDLLDLALAFGAGALSGTVVGLLAGGPDVLAAAAGRALGIGVSAFVLTALVLRLREPGRHLWRARPVELLATTVVLAAAYAVVFQEQGDLRLSFLLLPLSMWSALRFGATVAAGHVVLVGAGVGAQTLAGGGPFLWAGPAAGILLAQSSVLVTALVALSLGLFRDERVALVERLEAAGRVSTELATTLTTFLDTVDVGVVACDAEGRLTLFNRATRDFHGMPEDPGLDPADWADRYHLADEHGVPLELEQVPLFRALSQGEVHDATISITAHDQPARTFRCDGRRLVDPDGRVLGAVIAMKDVTEALAATRALEDREQRFRAAFHDSPTPSAHLDDDGVVRHTNAAFRRFLGVSSARLHGSPLSRHVHAEDLSVLGIATGGEGTGQAPVEVRLRRADGTHLWCELATTRSSRTDGQPYVLAQFLDVNARKQHERALEAAAQRDPLTGLGNRTALDARLGRLLDDGSDGVTVLFVDLDDFKAVNDTYGHEAGDAVLVELATRMQAAVRPDDLVARTGGDEFVLVCARTGGVDQPHATAALVERLEQALGAPVAHDGRVLSVGASIGAVSAPTGTAAQDVLDAADQAMYRRKKERHHHPGQQHAGSPRTRGEGPAPRTAGDDAALALSVATAAADGRLRLQYQPVYDLHTGACVGAEALLRMVDVDGSTVTPDRFIPVAEAHGHIASIGRWVVTEAVGRAAEWKRSLPADRPFLIGLNVSTLQLHDPTLVTHVRDVLEATGIDPAAVGLEMTESRLLPDTPHVLRVLSELHELGVRIAVDDFGTGYANLGYLATFPFDTLKIDRKYVSHLTGDGADSRLADGVFALARSTGMVVVAEGIETVEERDAVLATGCHIAQGFLFARPLPPEELLALLHAGPHPAVVPQRVPAQRC